MDFHFGGQHTSLTEDEAGGFRLWTRRLNLHGSTQPASCYLPPSCWTNPASPTPLPSPPLPAFPFLSSPVSGSRLFHSVAKVIALVSLPLYQTAFFIIQSRVPVTLSHPQPPTSSPLLSSKPPYQGDSSLIHTCDISKSASKQASERGNHPDSQPAVFFPMAAAPASKHIQSWLFAAVATAEVSRQQAPAQPALALSGLRGGGCWGAVRGEITAVVSRSPALSSAQEGSSRGGGGGSFSSIALCHFLSPGSLCYIYLIPFVSHLISPSFICP